MAEDELVTQLQGFAAPDALLDGDGQGQKPTEEQMAQTIVAPGRKAMLPFGVVYHGPWKYFGDGMGQHTREQVKALATTGIPLRLQAIGHPKFLNEELDKSVREVEYLERVSLSSTVLAVRQFIFHSLGFVQEQICPGPLRADGGHVAKHTIIYTSWERDRCYPQLIDELRNCAQVCCPMLSPKNFQGPW